MNGGESDPLTLTEQKRFPWRLFWLLALLVLLASLLLLPYALQLAQIGKPELANQAAVMRISATVGSVIQAILIYWPMTLLGLIFARRLGLGAPYLEALVGERPPQATWIRILIPSAWVGFGGGLLVLILSAVLGALAPAELARLNSTASSQSLPNAWQGFLGAISAGINEETLLRLFLLSLLAWSLQWLFIRRTTGRPAPAF